MKLSSLFVIVVSLLAFQTQASAAEIFSCEGTSSTVEEGKRLHFRLLEQKDGKFELFQDGIKSDEKVTLLKANLKNLSAYLKCSNYDRKCLYETSKKDEGFRSAGDAIKTAWLSAKQYPNKKQSSLATLDPDSIGSAKIYSFGESSKFSSMGVHEYYDKSNKLIGRYVVSLEVMNCSSQAKPSTPAKNTAGGASSETNPAMK